MGSNYTATYKNYCVPFRCFKRCGVIAPILILPIPPSPSSPSFDTKSRICWGSRLGIALALRRHLTLFIITAPQSVNRCRGVSSSSWQNLHLPSTSKPSLWWWLFSLQCPVTNPTKILSLFLDILITFSDLPARWCVALPCTTPAFAAGRYPRTGKTTRGVQ